jgi:hypothetical protein
VEHNGIATLGLHRHMALQISDGRQGSVSICSNPNNPAEQLCAKVLLFFVLGGVDPSSGSEAYAEPRMTPAPPHLCAF